MSTVDVTIAICTRNRADSLRMTLESLGKIEVPNGWSVELVVVDNGSTDQTESVVNSAPLDRIVLRYVAERRPGLSCARNKALAESKGRVLLFTDDDVRLPMNWIRGMCSQILDGSVDAVAGGISIAPQLVRPWFQPHHKEIFADTSGLNQQDPRCFVGANMAFAKSVTGRVPCFDEELGAGQSGFAEDLLFGMQVTEAGFHIRPAFDVCVMHHFDESRLLRPSLIDIAVKHGHSDAYIAYHWDHTDGRRYRRLRVQKLKARLALYRLTHPSEIKASEGLCQYEASLITAISYHQQYMGEAKRARNYERHGLVKLAEPIPRMGAASTTCRRTGSVQ